MVCIRAECGQELRRDGGGKARELDGDDGDVVLLAEGLRGAGDLFGGAAGEPTGAIEAEELTGGVLGFDHTIGGQAANSAQVRRSC